MKKKFCSFIALALVSAMVLPLSSCGNASKTTAAASGNSQQSKTVQITYWHMWGGDWKAWIDKQVANFNKTHSNIQVKALCIPEDGETKFVAAVAGGDPPDVFTGWGDVIATWATNNTITCLDSYISSQAPDMEDYLYPVASELNKYQGKTYAMSIDVSPYMLYWNKDLFKEVGLDPDVGPTTIEELDSMQSKFWEYNSNGSIKRMGFYPTYLYLWVPAFGGALVDSSNNATPTNQGLVNALKWFESYVTTKGYNMTKIDAFNKSLSNSTQSVNPFLTGKEAFTVDGMWLLTDIKKYAPKMNYGITTLPYPTSGGVADANIMMSDFDVIPTGAKHPKEAFEFIKWMVGYGGQEEAAGSFAAEGGNIPVAKKVVESSAFSKYLDAVPARKQFIKCLDSKNNINYPTLPYGSYYIDRLNAAEDRVMHKTQTAETALKQVDEEVKKEAAKQEATN